MSPYITNMSPWMSMISVTRKRSLEGEDEKPPKWRVRLGERAKNIRNPIREIMDTIAGKATQLVRFFFA